MVKTSLIRFVVDLVVSPQQVVEQIHNKSKQLTLTMFAQMTAGCTGFRIWEGDFFSRYPSVIQRQCPDTECAGLCQPKDGDVPQVIL